MSVTTMVDRIAALNDHARHGLERTAKLVITHTCLATIAGDGSAVAELAAQVRILRALREWTPPEGDRSERDLGYVQVDGHKIMFKVDYYAPDLQWGSEDPADPEQTIRVITVMLPSDY